MAKLGGGGDSAVTAQVARVMAIAVLVASCGTPSREGPRDSAAATTATLSVDTIASGLEVPWALGFTPDGRIFVTERVGRIRVIENGVLKPEPWATLPVAVRGEAGLMGLAIAPDFATSREIFVVGTFDDAGTLVNRVIRLTEENGAGVRPTVVLDRVPSAVFHAGDAIAFGPDGLLYVATGDARSPGNADDASSLAGKILRMRRDGAVPDDNPTPGSLVYASGVRNPQGITWNPLTGDMFASDHGPSGFPNELFRRDRDELNTVTRGGDYGWPTAAAGMSGLGGSIPPLVEWSSPGLAPSGIAAYNGPYEPWRNSIFVATLKGEQLRRVAVAWDSAAASGWRAISDEPLFVRAFGRLRAAAMGPDGMMYFTTSNRDGRGGPRPGDDHVLRIRVTP